MVRRLAAILVADMVGYSRLMEVDESGTITQQRTHREELIDPSIAKNNGRIVKLMGDGMLVEFASVVDAVQCAVEVQRGMATRVADVPEDRRIRYRIGINLGDVVIEGEDILGQGVNVAARLEGLADPGGVCVSDMVWQDVAGKLDLEFEHQANIRSRTSRSRYGPIGCCWTRTRALRPTPPNDKAAMSGNGEA